MDKIWDRKSIEVGGHWPLWREKTMQNRQKSKAKKQNKTKAKKIILIITIILITKMQLPLDLISFGVFQMFSSSKFAYAIY